MNTQLWGLGAFRPHRVVRSTLEVQDVSFGYVICANKNVHSSEAAIENAIRPAVRPATVLASGQKGKQPLRNASTRNTVMSAICFVICQQTGPVWCNRYPRPDSNAYHIGAFDHETNDKELTGSRVRDLVRIDAKFEEIDDINTEWWIKMIFNGSWNPVAALIACDTHQILQKPLYLAVVPRLAAGQVN